MGSKLNSSDLYGNQNEDLSSFSEIAVVGMSHKSYVSENAFLKTIISFSMEAFLILSTHPQTALNEIQLLIISMFSML